MSTEHCDACGRQTPHTVAVDIREEGDQDDPGRRKFSREPYRVTRCEACGAETATRMNNADPQSA